MFTVSKSDLDVIHSSNVLLIKDFLYVQVRLGLLGVKRPPTGAVWSLTYISWSTSSAGLVGDAALRTPSVVLQFRVTLDLVTQTNEYTGYYFSETSLLQIKY